MSQVMKQQMYLFPSDQNNNYNDGGDLYFYPISDFQHCPIKLPMRWTPLLSEFTPDTYANAVTDLSGWYNSTNGWTLSMNSATQGWNNGVLEIFDCKLYIEKYILQPLEAKKVFDQLSSGASIEIPYSMVQSQHTSLPASQSSTDIQINQSSYQNLERIMVLTRRTPDTYTDALRDNYVLRNGSDADLGTSTCTTNYSNGIIGSALDSSGNPITSNSTAIAGGLLWTARNYNGLYKTQIKWLSEELVRQSEYIYFLPYKFRNIRDWAR